MTSITDVEKIADLARLDIQPDQLEIVSENFSEILEYFNRLEKVDTSGVDPIYHAIVKPEGALADDVLATSSIQLEDVMKNAPQSRENQFRVPKVIE